MSHNIWHIIWFSSFIWGVQKSFMLCFFLFFRTASHSSSVSLSSWIFRSVSAFSIRLIRLIRLIGLIRNYFMKLLQLSFWISMLEQNLSKVSSRDLKLYFTNQTVMSSNLGGVKIFNPLAVGRDSWVLCQPQVFGFNFQLLFDQN